MTDKPKRYFAPLPNRVLVDERMHGLHLRFYGVVAAHDRFGQNGLGSTLSLQRYAEILNSHKQSIAKVRRQMIEWGYIEEHPHPRHLQMSMLSVVYHAEADKVALSTKTVSPQTDGSRPSTVSPQADGSSKTVSPQAHSGWKTVSPQTDTEETPLKRREETRLKTKEDNSAEAARPCERAPHGEATRELSIGGKLAQFEGSCNAGKTGTVEWFQKWRDWLEELHDTLDVGDPNRARADRLLEEIDWPAEVACHD